MAYITSEQYKEAIYSQDARHQLKVVFNGVELEDADNYCEKFTLKSRILSNSSKVFSLDNFVSDEAQLVLHNIDLEQVVGPVDIQIGTLVGDAYEFVPIGVFNIQDIPTTDKNKTTIKLRDNSVKFDFNYNAKPLMDANDGKATKLQILEDICSQAGVVCNIADFIGASDLVGSYDDSITARVYISYLAEQAGAIATINRYGELIFVYLNAIVDQQIPIDIVESYTNGERFKIARVLYEDGIRKFATPLEDENIDGDNLYLNTANPFIFNQEQVDSIYEIVKDFEINSFKTGRVIGNPSIDKYDIIQISDDQLNFRTFATYTMTYNGKILMTFETLIDQEKKQENVTKNGEEAFKRYARTNIDNINNQIDLVVTEQDGQKKLLEEMELTVDGIKNTFQVTGGNNYVKDSMGVLNDGSWDNIASITDTFTRENAVGQSAIMLNKSVVEIENLITNDDVNANYNTTFENGIVKQVQADTNNNPNWKVMQYNSAGQHFNAVVGRPSNNKVSFTFEATNETAFLTFGINGTVIDTLVSIDFTNFEPGQYTISAEILNSEQGSCSWHNMKLCKGDTTEKYNQIQKINCKNGTYTLSFSYLKTIELASCKIIVNSVEYDLSEYDTLTKFVQVLNVTTNELNIEFRSDTNNSCYILDLMMNDGEEVLLWTQNANETITDTVKIGKGIQVESSVANTIWRADADGSRVLNKTTGAVVREDTARGTVTNEFESKGTSNVNGMLVLKIGNQVWLNGV